MYVNAVKKLDQLFEEVKAGNKVTHDDIDAIVSPSHAGEDGDGLALIALPQLVGVTLIQERENYFVSDRTWWQRMGAQDEYAPKVIRAEARSVRLTLGGKKLLEDWMTDSREHVVHRIAFHRRRLGQLELALKALDGAV